MSASLHALTVDEAGVSEQMLSDLIPPSHDGDTLPPPSCLVDLSDTRLAVIRLTNAVCDSSAAVAALNPVLPLCPLPRIHRDRTLSLAWQVRSARVVYRALKANLLLRPLRLASLRANHVTTHECSMLLHGPRGMLYSQGRYRSHRDLVRYCRRQIPLDGPYCAAKLYHRHRSLLAGLAAFKRCWYSSIVGRERGEKREESGGERGNGSRQKKPPLPPKTSKDINVSKPVKTHRHRRRHHKG
ncbi:hypothetical protein KIPB_000468 [Kipferlia bialata]|uniref:Uncharacterized protein n=1 Tax=Kipferlia bialata TaxID=797122 RepID=A0A391NI52_9EUKA|nr:hypothetical protein KIPB_000468 [Kipferlia bialata]|eukprot:g468.t1